MKVVTSDNAKRKAEVRIGFIKFFLEEFVIIDFKRIAAVADLVTVNNVVVSEKILMEEFDGNAGFNNFFGVFAAG